MKNLTLKDGLGTTITFGTGESGTDHSGITLLLDPSSITPPGYDGGDAIDTTTHSNTAYKTKYSRTLLEVSDGSFTAAYDPDVYDDVLDAVNDNVLITFTFPDGASIAMYGFLKSFIPNELVEGEPATAECELVATNYNHSNGNETAPAYVAGS